jgi:hypothetical protein
MLRFTNPEVGSDSPHFALFAERIVAIPDKLVAVEMYLRPLCKGDATSITAEAKQTIGDAYEILRGAIPDVLEAVRYICGCPTLDGPSLGMHGARAHEEAPQQRRSTNASSTGEELVPGVAARLFPIQYNGEFLS